MGAQRREWIACCMELPGAYEDYPFDRDPGAPDAWTVMRHRQNRKAFAFLYVRGGFLNLNLKCEPMFAGLLRGAYAAVTPAYHMNKTHWNTVRLDGSVPEAELKAWIRQSFDLTLRNSKSKG